MGMNRTRLRTNPATWLASPPNSFPPAHVAQVLATFSSLPSVYVYHGPGLLICATGSDATSRRAAAYGGGYWVEGSILGQIDANLDRFVGWMTAKTIAEAKQLQFRGLTGLCEDWNDLSEFHQMDVPEGEVFEALAGPIKSQPLQSKLDSRASTTPMLRGGFDQVFLKVRNPFWITQKMPF